MYHLITGLYAEWTKKPRYNALMVGAAGVGKSCLLEKVSTVATLRFQLLPLTPFPPLLDQERLSQETGTAANRVAPTVGQNGKLDASPACTLHKAADLTHLCALQCSS